MAKLKENEVMEVNLKDVYAQRTKRVRQEVAISKGLALTGTLSTAIGAPVVTSAFLSVSNPVAGSVFLGLGASSIAASGVLFSHGKFEMSNIENEKKNLQNLSDTDVSDKTKLFITELEKMWPHQRIETLKDISASPELVKCLYDNASESQKKKILNPTFTIIRDHVQKRLDSFKVGEKILADKENSKTVEKTV